jgi:hypothetical protein
MTKQAVAANLVVCKTRLAEKYENLARISNSTPRKAKLVRLAARLRRQAATATLLEKSLAAKAAAKKPAKKS